VRFVLFFFLGRGFGSFFLFPVGERGLTNFSFFSFFFLGGLRSREERGDR